MRKALSFLFFVILTTYIRGQDLILKTDGVEIKANIIMLDRDTVRFFLFENTDSIQQQLAISQIVRIKYKTGMEQVFTTPGTALTPRDSTSYASPQKMDNYKAGIADAEIYYNNKSHFWGGVTSVPCGGVCTGVLIAAIPPQKKRLMLHDKRIALNSSPGWRTNFSDSTYVAGYHKGAHNKKILNVAKGYGIGTGALLGAYFIIMVAAAILSL